MHGYSDSECQQENRGIADTPAPNTPTPVEVVSLDGLGEIRTAMAACDHTEHLIRGDQPTPTPKEETDYPLLNPVAFVDLLFDLTASEAAREQAERERDWLAHCGAQALDFDEESWKQAAREATRAETL
jgi:hypothetical protein